MLNSGVTTLIEPYLGEILKKEVRDSQNLKFSFDAESAIGDADVVWITFDTPVDENNIANVEFVRSRISGISRYLTTDQTLIISSQVPIGFTYDLIMSEPQIGACRKVAVIPENLRHGKAVELFRNPGRMVIGTSTPDVHDQLLIDIFAEFCSWSNLLWMSYEAAELSKHALNGWLAMSIVYTNEIGRLAEKYGVDARQVEQALRTDPRVGWQAYVTPGPAIKGGTLLRDIEYLRARANEHGIFNPVIDAIPASNKVTLDAAS
jgi:UDPglucose 6-dehydrogenase